MRRHAIVGHFGSGQQLSVAARDNEVVTGLNLVASKKQLNHGIGRAITDLAELGIFPSEVGVDLLVLASLVHAADTRISRKSESQDTWTREIRLVVPVSDPERWTSATTLLQRMLGFLTGDLWELEFRSRPVEFTSIVTVPSNRTDAPPYDSLALFSGGLDSLIGVIDTLEAGGKPLLISHAGDGAASKAQTNCMKALAKYYVDRTFDRLRVAMTFPTGLVPGVSAENTMRGRSFLFFSIAIFAGSWLQEPFILRAAENGFIAINVPLDTLRLGALSTRTMHPFYIARWNELLRVLGFKGSIENPYRLQTKAEMITNCSNTALLRDLIPSSLSCSSPTKGRWQKRAIEHCGYCVPCLIRRAALLKGFGPGADPTTYTVQRLSAHDIDTTQAEGEQIRSVQYAIGRLRANPGLAKLLIHKPGPLVDVSPADLTALADVYRRGIKEVETLIQP